MGFSVLVQLTKLGPRSFPLTGLKELEPEWQEYVIEIIASLPVNQILRLSSFMASSVDTVPITPIEKPPIPLAV